MSEQVRDRVHAARAAALVHRDEASSVLAVRGADRVTWLNGLVTCNVATLATGQAVYGLAVTQKGRVLADVVVLAEADRLLLVVPASQEQELVAALDKYLVMEDVELTPAEVVVFRAHGPKSTEIADAARAAHAIAASLDAPGLGGALILAPEAHADDVAAMLARAATSVGGAVGDDASWEALRLERALPRYGRDFDLTTYPQEAALEKRAVSFDKGCYLGQEVVCMLEMRGHVKRRLVPLVLDDAEVPVAGAEVHDAAGGVVGQVTSAAFSPTLGKAVALAMVKAHDTALGTSLRVGGHGATVTEIPAP